MKPNVKFSQNTFTQRILNKMENKKCFVSVDLLKRINDEFNKWHSFYDYFDVGFVEEHETLNKLTKELNAAIKESEK